MQERNARLVAAVVLLAGFLLPGCEEGTLRREDVKQTRDNPFPDVTLTSSPLPEREQSSERPDLGMWSDSSIPSREPSSELQDLEMWWDSTEADVGTSDAGVPNGDAGQPGRGRR